MIKKIVCLLFISLLLSPVSIAVAADFGITNVENIKTGVNTKDAPAMFATDLLGVVGGIINAVLILSGTIFLGLTVYASILWLISQGNEEQIEKAKKILFAAVIGLIITMSAYAIAYLVNLRAENLK